MGQFFWPKQDHPQYVLLHACIGCLRWQWCVCLKQELVSAAVVVESNFGSFNRRNTADLVGLWAKIFAGNQADFFQQGSKIPSMRQAKNSGWWQCSEGGREVLYVLIISNQFFSKYKKCVELVLVVILSNCAVLLKQCSYQETPSSTVSHRQYCLPTVGGQPVPATGRVYQQALRDTKAKQI